MRKSRFTEEQIVGVLREHDAGAQTPELCRRHGISAQTLYRWKGKYGGMSVSDAQRLKQLEDENRRLEAHRRRPGVGHRRAEGRHLAKLVTPAARKPVVQHLREEWRLSERRACGLVDVSRMAVRYASRRDDTALRARLCELAAERRRWGYRKLQVLLHREGMHVNHKRVERIYREDGLSV